MTLPARLTGVIPPVCTPFTPDHEVTPPRWFGSSTT
jgi:4-hydroxy-tetrahydrodipicolinate synthase